jgi:hypothetical protein
MRDQKRHPKRVQALALFLLESTSSEQPKLQRKAVNITDMEGARYNHEIENGDDEMLGMCCVFKWVEQSDFRDRVFHARPFHDGIVILMNTVLPDLGVILIDRGDLAFSIDIDNHADVAFEVFAMSFDDHLASWSHNIVGASTNPYLLYNATGGCWMNRLHFC